MPGTAVLCFQMILKIRVAEAPVVMIAAHSAYGISAAVLATLIAAVLAGIAVVEAQAAVLAEVIRVVRVHCAHPLGAVGVALAALLAQLAGFAELVLVLLIRDPAVAARADVLVPLGAFHAGLAVRAAAGIGVVPAALLAQAALLAGLLGQQASSHCSQAVWQSMQWMTPVSSSSTHSSTAPKQLLHSEQCIGSLSSFAQSSQKPQESQMVMEQQGPLWHSPHNWSSSPM